MINSNLYPIFQIIFFFIFVLISIQILLLQSTQA